MSVKKITVLGSTGSIGKQTLDVVRQTGCAEIMALTAHSNIDLLEKQIIEFKPQIAALTDDKKAADLSQRIKNHGLKTQILSGMDGLIAAATLNGVEMVLNSLVGNVGLRPTIEAIKHKKDIALANKETLVSAGELVTQYVEENNVHIYPVDSEHSAIFQCLQGNEHNEISKIYLTASGGPFLGKTMEELKTVTLKQALNHPNWSMGSKISIDSATLMNKGLEVIEAKWLFKLPVSKIDIVVHPQSIIHSMVEFCDGAIMAQLSEPDMRVSIQYALTYPNRVKNDFPRINFFERNSLTFEKPRYDLFPCLQLAFDAIKIGGTMPAVLNAANEISVSKFLNEEIKFLDIARIIERTMSAYNVKNKYTLDDVFEADMWARDFAGNCVHV